MHRALSIVAAFFCSQCWLPAQCDLSWAAGGAPGGMPDSAINTSAVVGNGDLVCGGSFTSIGGIAASRIAIRSAGAWQSLGTGINGPVTKLVVAPNGDVIAAGQFTQAGGVPANNIARWDGNGWFPLGSGIQGSVQALAVMPNGTVVAGGGGSFLAAGGQPANYLARWNGSSWASINDGSLLPVTSLAVLPSGQLAIGSAIEFTVSSGRVDLWNGSSLSNLVTTLGPFPTGTIRFLQALANGDLLVGGTFTSIGGIVSAGLARRSGSAWTDLAGAATPRVTAAVELPNGDLVAAGSLALGAGFVAVARIGNGSWTALDAVGPVPPPSPPSTLSLLPDGEIAAGGTFQTIGGVASPYLALLRAPCPATVVSFGSGCAGAGGINQIAAATMPWIGSAYRARATGMPPLGLAAIVYGFTAPALPLQPFFAQAGPGCVGQVAADAIELVLPVAGVARSQLVIPNQPGLVGLTLHHYAFVLELDPLGALVAITSSNGLTLGLGTM